MYYQAIISIHALIGFAALISFWGAAFSRKGSPRHRLFGRAYLLSMVVILVSVIPMIIVKARAGDFVLCVVLAYLFWIALTASLISWESIRQKRAPDRYFRPLMRWVTAILFAYGLLVLGVGLRAASLLQVGFSSVGLVLGASLWMAYWRRERRANWHLSQHMNGVAVLFAATHGSFFRFGLTGLLPIADTPQLNTFAQISMIVLALILRLWLGRRYLHSRRRVTNLVAS